LSPKSSKRRRKKLALHRVPDPKSGKSKAKVNEAERSLRERKSR
jgi:hypothetical protein